MPHAGAEGRAEGGTRAQPVHLARHDPVTDERLARSDHHGARLGLDGHHVHRLGESGRQSLALTDGEVHEAVVGPDAPPVDRHDGPRRERGVVGAEACGHHFGVIAVRHEADVLAFRLGCHHAQTELAGDGARLGLGAVSHGEEHPRQHLAPDAPEEVTLVLGRILPHEQPPVDNARVVARGHPMRIDAVGGRDQVAELGEGVAPHARDRGATARVLGHEVVHHVPAERRLQVEHVVRHADRLAHAPGVVHRVERAARPVGHVGAVVVELHRHADDVEAVALEERRAGRRVDATRHGHEHALSRGGAPRALCVGHAGVRPPPSRAPSRRAAGRPVPRDRWRRHWSARRATGEWPRWQSPDERRGP